MVGYGISMISIVLLENVVENNLNPSQGHEDRDGEAC